MANTCRPAYVTGAAARRGQAAVFDGATGWLKDTLVIFWTYTCINWLRWLPYLRAWAGKYADHSLAVIGVHTPEFGFEHELANVRRAVHDMRIDDPVALDNDYAVRSVFDNHYADAVPGAPGRAAARPRSWNRRGRSRLRTLAEQRLYQLVRQHGPVTERTFQITFPDPGAAAYAFTFG